MQKDLPLETTSPPLPDQVTEEFATEHLRSLQAMLSLSAAQQQSVRAILLAQLPDRAGLVRAAAASAEDDESAAQLLEGAEAMRQLRRPGKFADAIARQLTPDQQALWQSNLAKMATDDAEVASSRELAAIQARTSLTEDQKNAIFTVLHNQALAEQGTSPVTLTEAQRDEELIQARMDALAPHLTPEQLLIARRALEQSSIERVLSPLEPLGVFDGQDP